MGGGTVTSDTIPREEVPRTLQANNVLLQIWAICPHGSMGPLMRRFFLNDQPHSPLQFGPHTCRLPISTASQVFIQGSRVFFPSLMRRGSAQDSPTRSSMGTLTQLPHPRLSFSSNSDLLAPRHLLSTSDANPAMPHVLKTRHQALTGPPLV